MENLGSVFLSYAHEDEDLARRLYNDLKQRNVDVWMDKESLVGGEEFDIAIRKAIESCRFFLLILSKVSVTKSGYVNKEIRKAIDVFNEFPEGKRFILPIRKNECESSYEQLRRLQWVDLFPEYEKGLERLLRSLGARQEVVVKFPSYEYMETQILNKIKGLKTHYITSLGDLIIFSSDYKSSVGSWSYTRESLELVEWDFINEKYKSNRNLFYGASHAQFITGGTDEYHDEKISGLHFDYASNLLSWDEIIKDETENEWTSDHEVVNEQITHRVFDTIKRQFVKDIVDIIGNNFV
jgi:hypothetical protein